MPLIFPVIETEEAALAEDFGFVIVVDILPASMAQPEAVQRFTVRLLVDGSEIPVAGYTYREPTGSLGASLSVELARPLLSQISSSSVFTFERGIWNGEGWTWITLLSGGRLAGREYSVGFTPGQPVGAPSDSLSFNSLNPLADRWHLAPRQPVTLYDSLKISLDELPEAKNAIRGEEGSPILPVLESEPGLTLHQVFERAYVEGCGFASVVTNLPDFPVTRADFTLQGGFHAGIAPLVRMFNPVYFADESNRLWILDTSDHLPAGLTMPVLPISNYSNLSDSQAPGALTNALILTYVGEAGDYFDYRFDVETSEQGNFGERGYTETTVTRKVRQYRNASDPSVIVREVVEETATEVINYQLETIHRETQQDQYDSLSRKVGHFRQVESLVPSLPSGDLLLQTTLEEQCSISYRPNSRNARESLQDRVTTLTSGLIHLDNDNTYRDEPFKLPVTDAHRNGFVDASGDQALEWGAIKTTIEMLDVKPSGQLDVIVIVIDHIAGTTERSSSQPRTGQAGVETRAGAKRSVLLAITGTESDARVVPEFDAGDLPSDLALDLGRRHLARLNSPPRSLSLSCAFIDDSLRRGSLRQVEGRSGTLGLYIVTGRTERGSRQGDGFFVSMTVEAEEVQG
jgi:hypothetical protein